MRPEKIIQLVEHHARTDTDRASLRIEVRDAAIVPRKIHNHPLAHATANQSRTRATRNHRYTRIRRRMDYCARLFGAARKSDRNRFDLIMRRVRGIKLPRHIIEPDLTRRRLEN